MNKILLQLICIVFLAASCARDNDIGGGKAGKQVEFRFDVSSSTRAVDDTAINQLDVLVFRRQAAYPTETDKSVYLYTRYAWKVSDGRWRTNLAIGDNLDIYFAVNAHETLKDLALEGKEYADAAKLMVLNDPGADIGAMGLPMWGSIRGCTVADKAVNDLGTVALLRSVASTDITVEDDDFTLQEASLCYAADRGFLPFDPSRAGIPQVPDNMNSDLTADWTHTVLPADNNCVEDIFYMYENDAPSSASLNRSTKLVLKGQWNNTGSSGQPTWYPIALRSKNADGEMVKSPVVRNNKYIVVITKVNGDGYPSFDEAKNAEPVNIDYDVVPWDEEMDGGIFIDGMQYVMLRRDRNERRDDRTAVVYRDAGSDDRIVFRTNIPLDQFSMELDNGGDFPDPADKTAIANDRFKAEIKTEGSNNFFNFTALVSYGLDSNPSTLTVTAGRIRFDISIIQRSNSPDDWDDGGGLIKDL